MKDNSLSRIEAEIEIRKIQASTKETPHCFGDCLTLGDVKELLEMQKQESLKEELKFLKEHIEKLRQGHFDIVNVNRRIKEKNG